MPCFNYVYDYIDNDQIYCYERKLSLEVINCPILLSAAHGQIMNRKD